MPKADTVSGGRVAGSGGDEAVQVHVQAEVAAEPLDRHEHARVQRRHGREVVALLHRPPYVLRHRLREALGDPGQERMIVAQAHGHRPREREHPLSVTHRRQHVVDQQRRTLRHSPPHARRATAATLTREGHTQLVATLPAGRPHKASSKSPHPANPSSSFLTNSGSE